MPEQPKERETIPVKQLAISNAYQLEAMLNVLERKGLLTSKEVLDELEVVVQTKGRKEINWPIKYVGNKDAIILIDLPEIIKMYEAAIIGNW